MITIPSITLDFNNVCTLIATLSGVISAYLAYRTNEQARKEKKSQRILKKNFGSELFGKETIQRSTYCYVEPNCTDIDPTLEAEPKNLFIVKGNLFSVLDDYLLQEIPTNDAIHHILILADSGMGKTSLLLNYYAYNQKKSKRKRQRIALVPLGIPNIDEYINKINNKENTVIFLDAFDEDTKAINNHQGRLSSLMTNCSQFRRVVITCRTQFFPSDEEIPKEPGIVKVGPLKAGEKGMYIFNKLYLSPLSDVQVDEYLKIRFKWKRKKQNKAKLLIKKIPNLKVRPMLLANIPDLIESGQKDMQYTYQLYEVMVDNWLEREKRWVNNKEDLRQFSEMLAFDIYINRKKRGSEKIPINELSVLAKEWNIQLEGWQLTGRSLLNRDAEGNYKFAHRSIMEFLFVVHFFKMKFEERSFIKWTDQQKKFSTESLKLKNDNDFSKVDFSDTNLAEIDFNNVNLISINFIGANLKNAKGLPEWVVKGLDNEGIYSQYRLVEAIKQGFNNLSGANLLEANLTNIKLTNVNLENTCLLNAKGIPEWVVKGLDNKGIYSQERLVEAIKKGFNNLSGANLLEANLTNIKLTNVNLENTCLLNAKGLPEWVVKGLDNEGTYSQERLVESIKQGFNNLSGANLTNSDLSQRVNLHLTNVDLQTANFNLTKADLSGANISGADLSGANLSGANISGADLTGTNFSETNLEYANLKDAKGLPGWVEKRMDENGFYLKLEGK